MKVCGVCTFPAAFCDAVPEGGAGASSLERAATGESFVSRFSMSARTQRFQKIEGTSRGVM